MLTPSLLVAATVSSFLTQRASQLIWRIITINLTYSSVCIGFCSWDSWSDRDHTKNKLASDSRPSYWDALVYSLTASSQNPHLLEVYSEEGFLLPLRSSIFHTTSPGKFSSDPAETKILHKQLPPKPSFFSYNFCSSLSPSTTTLVPCNFQGLRLTTGKKIARIIFSWLTRGRITPSKGKVTIRFTTFDNLFLHITSLITEGKTYTNLFTQIIIPTKLFHHYLWCWWWWWWYDQ